VNAGARPVRVDAASAEADFRDRLSDAVETATLTGRAPAFTQALCTEGRSTRHIEKFIAVSNATRLEVARLGCGQTA